MRAAAGGGGHRRPWWRQLQVAAGAARPNKPLNALGQGLRGPAVRPPVRA